MLETHARERGRGTLGPSVARARRSESDDEVRQNIPEDYRALFEKVKSKIRGSGRSSRTEAFLQYAEEHPREIVGAIDDISETKIRALEQAHRAAQKVARKRRYTAAELAEVPF